MPAIRAIASIISRRFRRRFVCRVSSSGSCFGLMVTYLSRIERRDDVQAAVCANHRLSGAASPRLCLRGKALRCRFYLSRPMLPRLRVGLKRRCSNLLRPSGAGNTRHAEFISLRVLTARPVRRDAAPAAPAPVLNSPHVKLLAAAPGSN